MTNTRELIHDKAKQILYAGDAYDAGDVFEESEYERAKRTLGDYASHPNADPLVKERAETAIEQIEEVQ